MSPSERREQRILELCRIVNRLADKGNISVEQIIKEVTARANRMASQSIAREYVEEVIKRFSKHV